MANVANDAISATYGGAQLNEIFYEPVFRSDDIMRNYRVIPNVKHVMNVYTAAALTKIVEVYSTCSTASGANQFDISDKVITAGRCRVALEQCTDEFFGTFIEESYRSGADVMNIEGTQLADAIVNRAVKGIASDVVRLAWGGDVAGAVAGYAVFNGWMELMKAEPVLTFNSATPADPIASDALSLIMNVYDGAPAALQQVAPADKKMFVTPKLYNAYLQNIEGNGADLAIVNMVDASPRVSFRGVELVAMYEWDTILADTNPDLFVNGGANFNQGVCYTAVENLIIGSDVTDPEGSFKVFYDDLEEKMFFRGYFKLGVQYLYSSLVQWGIAI
tara:strand:+ start:142 stop:1140 length:999 start_codon:yes stop_codon:yes gene_type:complete